MWGWRQNLESFILISLSSNFVQNSSIFFIQNANSCLSTSMEVCIGNPGPWPSSSANICILSPHLGLEEICPRYCHFPLFLMPRKKGKVVEKGKSLIFNKQYFKGAPGWLSQLSIQPRLRSWSHGSWIWALCQAPCWQCGACLGFSLSPSLPLCPPWLLLSLSQDKLISKLNFF